MDQIQELGKYFDMEGIDETNPQRVKYEIPCFHMVGEPIESQEERTERKDLNVAENDEIVED